MKKKINRQPINWARKNKWFGEDQYKTYYAFDIHHLLMKNNIDPETKSYYKIIDGFMDHYDEIKKIESTSSVIPTNLYQQLKLLHQLYLLLKTSLLTR